MSAPGLYALIAAGIAINALSLAGALHRLLRLRLPRSRREAVATLILPLTGEAEGLDALIAALDAQTLRPRRLIVAVESEDDPAYPRALAVARQAAFPIETVVAGAATDQAQKCRNQVAGLARIDAADQAIVFLDGDILPTSWWLSALVSPLVDASADLVTGHRWQVLAQPRLGAHLATALDRALTLLPRADARFAHVVWGGSLAVSPRAAAVMDLAACLRGTLSDDLSLAERAAAAGLRVLTRGALLVPSPCRLGLVAAWQFGRRQYQIGHIYRPWLWRLAALTVNLRLAAWAAVLGSMATTGTLVGAGAALWSLALAKQVAVWRIGARVGLPDPPTVQLVQLLLGLVQPLVDVFHSSLILAAAHTRSVTWGHIVYRVAGPHAIEVEARRPWEPEAGSGPGATPDRGQTNPLPAVAPRTRPHPASAAPKQQPTDPMSHAAPAPDADLPPCPLTGKPALRRVHGVAAGTIEGIWRLGQGVDVSRLLAGHDRLGLYESPTGLYFFEPRIVGDGRFYADYYRRWHVHEGLTLWPESRADYIRAAGYIQPGAEVIDVGCGPGVFRRHLPQARYTGLDPYAGPDADAAIVRETLEVHAQRRPASYDVAAAFHVIEHVADPRRHAELMVRLLRPGGLLILAAPLHPSPLTEIPNLPINIPPHHVTWWNPPAFRALADELGLAVIEASALPPSPHQGTFYWLHRLLFRRTDPPPNERYVAHRWAWHASIAIAYQLARVAHRIRAMPSGVRPIDAFLVARKVG